MISKNSSKEQKSNPILRFLASILRSILLSILLMVFFISVITKEFPPNPTRIRNIFESTKRLLSYTQNYLDTNSADDIENDLKKFRELQDRRLQESKNLDALLNETREQINTLRTTTGSQEITNLKSKVEILMKHQKTLEERLDNMERKIR